MATNARTASPWLAVESPPPGPPRSRHSSTTASPRDSSPSRSGRKLRRLMSRRRGPTGRPRRPPPGAGAVQRPARVGWKAERATTWNSGEVGALGTAARSLRTCSVGGLGSRLLRLSRGARPRRGGCERDVDHSSSGRGVHDRPPPMRHRQRRRRRRRRCRRARRLGAAATEVLEGGLALPSSSS